MLLFEPILLEAVRFLMNKEYRQKAGIPDNNMRVFGKNGVGLVDASTCLRQLREKVQ